MLNALWAAPDVSGREGRVAPGLPHDAVLELLRAHGAHGGEDLRPFVQRGQAAPAIRPIELIKANLSRGGRKWRSRLGRDGSAPALPQTPRGQGSDRTGRPRVAARGGVRLHLPASAQAAGYQDAVLAEHPLTYLRLDETPGATVAQDASLNDRDGTYAGAVDARRRGAVRRRGHGGALASGGTVIATVDPREPDARAVGQPGPAGARRAGRHRGPRRSGRRRLGARHRRQAQARGRDRRDDGADQGLAGQRRLDAGHGDLVGQAPVYVNGALKKAFNGAAATGAGAFVVGGDAAGAFSGNFAGAVDEAARSTTSR